MSEHQPVFTDQQFWEIKRLIRDAIDQYHTAGMMYTAEAKPVAVAAPTVTVGAPPVQAPHPVKVLPKDVLDTLKFETVDNVVYANLLTRVPLEVWKAKNELMQQFGFRYVVAKGWTR